MILTFPAWGAAGDAINYSLDRWMFVWGHVKL